MKTNKILKFILLMSFTLLFVKNTFSQDTTEIIVIKDKKVRILNEKFRKILEDEFKVPVISDSSISEKCIKVVKDIAEKDKTIIHSNYYFIHSCNKKIILEDYYQEILIEKFIKSINKPEHKAGFSTLKDMRIYSEIIKDQYFYTLVTLVYGTIDPNRIWVEFEDN